MVPTLACSDLSRDPNTGASLFCCIDWIPGLPPCAPNDELPICTGPDWYAFGCSPGADPATLDPSFHCSAPVADPSGPYDDFCCTHP
jgi:hypothetical protein